MESHLTYLLYPPPYKRRCGCTIWLATRASNRTWPPPVHPLWQPCSNIWMLNTWKSSFGLRAQPAKSAAATATRWAGKEPIARWTPGKKGCKLANNHQTPGRGRREAGLEANVFLTIKKLQKGCSWYPDVRSIFFVFAWSLSFAD